MGFEFRYLDVDNYKLVVKELDLILEGDTKTKNNVVEWCVSFLKSDLFIIWNSESKWKIDLWEKKILNTISTKPEEFVNTLAPIVIPLKSMPLYQFSYLSCHEQSPNLVILGEDDGGLYGILRESDSWFDDLLSSSFNRRCEKYSAGEAMFILDTKELELLNNAVKNTVIPEKSDLPGFSREWCIKARLRLLELIKRCLDSSKDTICIIDSGFC
jgi:hypothetical protein